MSNLYDALTKSRGEKLPELALPVAPAASSSAPLPGRVDPLRDRELEAVRQRILLEVGRDRPPVLVFTGAVPGEGASTLALHFARELAEAEQRPVLLVDGDLAPSSQSLTGALQQTAEGNPGLTDVLAGQVELSTVVLGTDQPNLHFLPRGRETAAPLELVKPERVQRLIHEVGRLYAFIVIDVGASLRAPEAAILAATTDGVVLVVRANRTRREVVQKAVHVLHRSRCKLLGVILNDRRYPIPEFLYRRV